MTFAPMVEPSWQMQAPPDAPVIVVLHAIATHRALWAPQIAIWSANWRVLAVDLPGHGVSAPPERNLSASSRSWSVSSCTRTCSDAPSLPSRIFDSIDQTRLIYGGRRTPGTPSQLASVRNEHPCDSLPRELPRCQR